MYQQVSYTELDDLRRGYKMRQIVFIRVKFWLRKLNNHLNSPFETGLAGS